MQLVMFVGFAALTAAVTALTLGAGARGAVSPAVGMVLGGVGVVLGLFVATHASFVTQTTDCCRFVSSYPSVGGLALLASGINLLSLYQAGIAAFDVDLPSLSGGAR
jgi:uncharacterized membrane protein YqgA involved in biofilm formation